MMCSLRWSMSNRLAARAAVHPILLILRVPGSVVLFLGFEFYGTFNKIALFTMYRAHKLINLLYPLLKPILM